MAVPDINSRLSSDQYAKIQLQNTGGSVLLEYDPQQNPYIPIGAVYGSPIKFFEITDNTYVETFILEFRRKGHNGEILPLSFSAIPNEQIDTLRQMTTYPTCYVTVGYGTTSSKTYSAFFQNVSYQSIARTDNYNLSITLLLLEEV